MKKGKILVVDDNLGIRKALQMLLPPHFAEVEIIPSPNSIESAMCRLRPDVVLLDMNFYADINTGNEGLYWIDRIKRIYPDVQVVLFTTYADIALAVEGMKRGAFDFVVKPWDNDRLIEILQSAIPSKTKKSQKSERISPFWVGGYHPFSARYLTLSIKFIRSMRRFLFFLTICLLFPIHTFALGGKEHAADMQRIFPFAESVKNKKVTDLYRRVNEFLDFPYVQPGQKHDKSDPKRPLFVAEHPKFNQIQWQGKHRIWFHWGFNTDPRKFPPIVNSLNQAVREGVINQQDVAQFWSMMNIEISRRNRTLMNEGAKVFGFGELGTISAQQRRQLNGLVTILYSIHVIGDHKTTDKEIIAPLGRVYADINNAIDNIAGKEAGNLEKAKELKKQLRAAQSSPDAYLDALERAFTPFILSLTGEGYNYKQRFKKLGYVLKER